jgi:hypothetical protein
MTGLFDQIKLLFEQQLYTNVVTLVRFNIVMSNQTICRFARGQNFMPLQFRIFLLSPTVQYQREIISDYMHVGAC